LIVAESDPRRGSALRVVATAANEAEAELFQQRLAQAGIQATLERVIGGPEWGASGARYVYVAATDLERAREVLDPPDEPELGG
jgi:putative signal transducing protein